MKRRNLAIQKIEFPQRLMVQFVIFYDMYSKIDMIVIFVPCMEFENSFDQSKNVLDLNTFWSEISKFLSQGITLRFFIKFVSWANSSNTYPPSE